MKHLNLVKNKTLQLKQKSREIKVARKIQRRSKKKRKKHVKRKHCIHLKSSSMICFKMVQPLMFANFLWKT